MGLLIELKDHNLFILVGDILKVQLWLEARIFRKEQEGGSLFLPNIGVYISITSLQFIA